MLEVDLEGVPEPMHDDHGGTVGIVRREPRTKPESFRQKLDLGVAWPRPLGNGSGVRPRVIT